MCPINEPKRTRKEEKRRVALVIVAEPSPDELRPSEEAKEELQRLLTWENRSKKRDWVVGRPFK